MTKQKAFGLILAAALVSYALNAWGGATVAQKIEQSVFSVYSITIGLVIASIGIFLSTVGNLYTFFASDKATNAKIKSSDLLKVIERVDRIVDEIKQNAVLLICLLAASIVVALMISVDIPYVRWPFQSVYFSKSVIYPTFILCCVLTSLIAIVDVVLSMFSIYHHYSIIVRNSLQLVQLKKSDEEISKSG